MAKFVITFSGTGGHSPELARAVEHVAQDPVMRKLIARVGPCQLRKRRAYFFILCDSIISQQLSTKVAGVLLERFRERCTRQGRRYPAPEDVLACDAASLRRRGLSHQKISYLKDLARHFVERKINPAAFSKLSDEEIIAELTKVKGIGRWTAEMFLIFALCRLDVWPVDDLGIRKAAMLEFKLGAMPSAEQLRRIAARRGWRPYRSVAAWYLWRSLSTPAAAPTGGAGQAL